MTDNEIIKAKEEIERLIKIIADKEYSCMGLATQLKITNELLKTAKSEAIKEFAERLCDGRVSNDPVVIAVKVELERMKELPTADVADVRRGKWDSNGEFHQCSVCTNFTSYAYDYCPYCGAEMTEVEE